MKEKIKALSKNHIFISFATSMFAVFLAWGIFVAQYLLSDGVTLARNGDEARQTFPAFVEMGELISEGITDGVDVFTANGSNSVHLNGLEWYLPYRIFAYLGSMTSPLLMFMLFLAVHMFINMYFTQRLCYVHFGMKPSLSLLIAVSIASVAFGAVWFAAFFVIISLVIPLVYGVICMLKNNSIIKCILASFLYVLAFTSGQSLLSCILALSVFVFSLLYSIIYKVDDTKRVVVFSFSSAVLGAIICVLYLFGNFFSYQSSSTKTMTSLSNAIALSGKPSVILTKIFFSSSGVSLGEWILYLGLIWLFLIIVFVHSKITLSMDKKEKIVFWFGILTTVFILCADLSGVLPFEKWFYMFPFFGGMHLRRRYFLIFVPFLFLSFGVAVKNIKKKFENKEKIKILATYVLIFAGIYIVARENINKEAFIVELILAVIAVNLGLNNGFASRKFLIIFSCIVFCYGVNTLYSLEEVTVPASSIKNRSIAFDSEKQVALDNFVSGLPKQEIYKYVGVEGDESNVPIFIPGNYGWYHRQTSVLSNYLKYPLHARAFIDKYKEIFSIKWYDTFNMDYCRDTRADFVILTKEVMDKNPDNYVLDESVPSVYLNETMFCAKLKKYIPRHYTQGEAAVLDENSSLDNGYFYCPTLNNESILDFDTDNRTFFKITLDSKEDAEVQYSMFACDNYMYYIDGKKYEPQKDYGLAYFSIPKGRHSIEIRYRDSVQIAIYRIFTVYYALILFGGVGYGIFSIVRRVNHE